MKNYFNFVKLLAEKKYINGKKYVRFVEEYYNPCFDSHESNGVPFIVPFDKIAFEIHLGNQAFVIFAEKTIPDSNGGGMLFLTLFFVQSNGVVRKFITNITIFSDNWFCDGKLYYYLESHNYLPEDQTQFLTNAIFRMCVTFERLTLKKTISKKYYRDPTPVKSKKVIPFNEYWMLNVNPNYIPPATPYLGGTHARPREHDRRAHTRTNSAGKEFKVRATVVNKGIGTRIKKDYHIDNSDINAID